MRTPRVLLTLSCCFALAACSAMDAPTTSQTTSPPRSLAKWVMITPATPTLAPGATLALDVVMQDASGRVLSGQPEAWSTSDSAVATVSGTGVVSAHATGAAKIFVTSGTQSAFADITVSTAAPAPRWVSVNPGSATVQVRQTLALFAMVTDAGSHLVTDVPVTWTSANPAIATIDTTGAVTGVAAGAVNIVVRAGTNQSTAQVTVIPAAVVVAPAPPPPAPVTPPVSSGSLYGSYSSTSPHWPHIRTMMTDFYYGWTSAERTWAGQHYDYAMSGSGTAWLAGNPTVGHFPYTLEWTVIIPGAAHDGLTTVYYADMVAWYRAHPSLSLESAFLHRAGASRDSAGRAVVSIWGSARWMVNPADAGAREYQADRFTRIVANEGGAFVDEAGSGDMLGRIRGTQEYPTSDAYVPAQTAAFAAIKRAMGTKVLMLNTAEYRTDFDRANAVAAGAAHMELINNPLSANMPSNWQWIESLVNSGVFVDMVAAYSTTYANSIPTTFPHGNSATSAQRMKLWELASYYLVVPSNPALLALQLENAWNVPYSSMWLRAQEANIGHPVGARVFASRGTDPLGQAYVVYTREMDRALIVVRVNQGWGAHSYIDGTAVTIPLPTTDQWLPLHADGTLGAAVTSVTLRNVEAAILVKGSRL
jgi:hypothetical protein